MSNIEIELDQILANLSTEGRLHWENAVLKTQMQIMRGLTPEVADESPEMGQCDD